MNQKGKIFLGLMLALFAGLVAWVLTSIPEPPVPVPPDNAPRIMSYEDNVINEYKDGKLIWEIKSKKMSVDVDTRESIMEDITGKFFAEDGRVMELTADKGTYNQNNQNIVLIGRVHAHNGDGFEVSGDKLTWDSAAAVLAVEGNAEAKKDDMRATGDRMETSNGFNHFKIIGHAHLEKGVRDEKK